MVRDAPPRGLAPEGSRVSVPERARVVPLHLLVLALVSGAAALLAFAGLNPAAAPPWSDMWDYLQLARQLHAGQGFSSLFTYPIFLSSGGADGGMFAELWRPPGFPLLVAALFPFGGGPFTAAPLVLQIAGYALAVLGTYLLALEFVSGRWALLAALVVALSPGVLGVTEPGIATSLFTAGLVFGFLLATRAGTRLGAAATGLLFGVLLLLRGETLLLLPALVWFLWAGERGDRHRRIWICLAAVAVVQVPWVVRNALVTGRPFFSPSSLLYVDTSVFPGWESSRHLDLLDRSPLLWALGHLDVIAHKALRNLFHFLRQGLLLPLPALAPFVWAATGRLTGLGKVSAYCASVLIGLGLFVLLLAPLEYAPRLLHPFIPLLAVVGVLLLERFREVRWSDGTPRVAHRPTLFIAGAVLVLALLEFVAGVTASRREWRAWERENLPRAAALASLAPELPPEGWYLADYPTWYAWHLRRRFVWLPVAADLPRVRVAGTPPAGLLVDAERGAPGFDPTGLPTARQLEALPELAGWTRHDAGAFVRFVPGAPR